MYKTLIFITFLLTIFTGIFDRKYTAVIGNLCEKTAENPMGYCYGQLPQKGFPIPYIKDKPTISVEGKFGPEDFETPQFIIGFALNWLIYFLSIYLLFLFLNKSKKRRK